MKKLLFLTLFLLLLSCQPVKEAKIVQEFDEPTRELVEQKISEIVELEPVVEVEQIVELEYYATINGLTIPLELAITREEKEKGLMFRKELSGGLIFVFEKEIPMYFWMKNTLIPLDIIYIDENYRIVDFKENFQPCNLTESSEETCPIHKSKPAKYAIEVNAGFVKQHNLQLNELVELKI